MAGPMDIFGVELEDLQDVYKEKMVPYLDSDSFIGSTADKAAALMNPALAKTFDVLSMEKFKDSLPTIDELDEKFKDGTVLEQLQAQAQSIPRAGIEAMNWLFKDAARVYKNRQDKLEAGMDMKDIIAEESLEDTFYALIGPAEIGGVGIPKKVYEKFGPGALPVLQNLYLKMTGKEIEKPKREKITMEDLELFSDRNAMPLAFGGSPGEEGQFSDSIDMTGMKGDDVDIKEIINQPGFMGMDELDIFEEAKKQGLEEVQVAGLFGKVPMWAAANVDKAKMLLQIFTKNEKKNMDNIKKKLGTKDEVKAEIEDIDIIDTPAGGTEVATVKNKKTIIDSPEDAEAVFYSGVEARLMDPNTPPVFNTTEQLYDFLNTRGVSKAEIEDNALLNYIETAKKNKTPLVKEDMLEIIRAAPLRKIDNVTYGEARYGGEKNALYGNAHMESGHIPGTYREEVMYVSPKDIPLDPDELPGSTHDFVEKYVIGWSRLTDRKATLPVEKTAEGIEKAVDPAMIRTLKRNQTKLNNQLKGLETSALRKLEREGLVDIDNIDELTMAEVRNVLNQDDNMARLNSIDPALEQQILQFRMKLDEDALKLQNIEATTKGQEVIVTFADEIQSDILQQAKRFEEKLRTNLSEIMDLSEAERRAAISRAGYDSNLRDVNPEVAKYYIENETVFRPLFQSAAEMQQFMDEFVKNKLVFEELAAAGTRPDKQLIIKANEAAAKEKQMLMELQTAISEGAMKKLYPNVPFKNRSEWGEALIKRDLAKAAKLLYQDKIPDAATWYAVTPANKVIKRYNQKGGTHIPFEERTTDMKGIGTEEFYGGPDSVSSTIDKSGTAATNPNFNKPKHYTSVIEKALRRAAKENNSEFKTIKVEGVGDVYAIKITPEMLLPHKTHRKKGGMVYTPEIIDIFEAA